jgi:hypothetical protein
MSRYGNQPAVLSQTVLELFVPRPPLKQFASDDPHPQVPKQPLLTGVGGEFYERVREAVENAPPYTRTLSMEERREKKV